MSKAETAAASAVSASNNIPDLAAALNAYADLRGNKRLGANSEIEHLMQLPQFKDEWPDVDWDDFTDEPLSADDSYVLFNDCGRYYYMTWENVLSDPEE